jgi:hypothetical protein
MRLLTALRGCNAPPRRFKGMQCASSPRHKAPGTGRGGGTSSTTSSPAVGSAASSGPSSDRPASESSSPSPCREEHPPTAVTTRAARGACSDEDCAAAKRPKNFHEQRGHGTCCLTCGGIRTSALACNSSTRRASRACVRGSECTVGTRVGATVGGGGGGWRLQRVPAVALARAACHPRRLLHRRRLHGAAGLALRPCRRGGAPRRKRRGALAFRRVVGTGCDVGDVQSVRGEGRGVSD